jgi:translocation and assembly module TamB
MSAVDRPIDPVPPPRRRRLWARVLALVVGIVVILVLVVAGGAWWLLGTAGGAQFAAAKARAALGKDARIEGVEGTLGGPLRIREIVIDRPDLYVRVEDAYLDTAASAALHGALDVRKLTAKSVEVRTASSKAAAKAPSMFAPPFPVRLEDGRVATLRIGAITPEEQAAKDAAAKRAAREAARAKDVVLHDIALAGAGDARRWTITKAAVASEYGTAQVKGTLGNVKPHAVDLTADAAGKVQDYAYRLAAKVGGTLERIEAKLDGSLAGTPVTARATLTPFAKQPVASVALEASGVDLAKLKPGLPATRLDVHAALEPQGEGFAGPVRVANGAPGRWDQGALPFSQASARVAADPSGSATLSDLKVALAGGGTASGTAQVGGGGAKADLALANVDLSALHSRLQPTKLTGNVSLSGDRDAQRFTVSLEDPRFAVRGRGSLANERLAIDTATVKTGSGAVTAKGTMALAGSKEFRFEGRAEHFDPSAFVKTAAGDLNFDFTTSGAMADGVSGRAHVAFAPSRYAGLPLGGRVDVAGDAKRVSSADVHLTLGDARVDARGSFGRAGDAMDVALHAPNLSVLAKPFGVPVSGRLDAQGRLTGTFDAPAGHVTLTGANLGLPSNVYLADAKLQAQAGSAADSRIDATFTAHGVALGKETPPSPFADAITASLAGTRAAHTLKVEARMTKESTLTAAVEGGLDPRAAKPAWNGRVRSLALAGPGAFALTAPASLVASAERIELGDATLRGEWGEAHFQQTRWTPETLDVQGSTPGVEIQALARSLRLGRAPRSNLVVAGSWRVHAAQSFNGSVELHRLSGDVRVGTPALALGLSDLTLRADVSGSRARANLHIAGERIGTIEGDANATLARGPKGWQLAPDAPVAARLSANIPDLSAFAAWVGPDAQIHGRLAANASVSGTGAAPRIAGEVRASELAAREAQTGFEIEQGEVALRLDGKRIAIDRLVAKGPWHPPAGARERIANAADHAPGTLTASGSLDLEAREGRIVVRLAQLPVTQTPNRFVAISGEARLEATKQGVLAAGDLKADAGWIGALESAPPSVSDDVVVVRAARPQEKPQPGIAGERIHVDARFDLGDQLYFVGRGLDTRLAGNLHVTGTPAALRATGTVRTVGGTYNGYGQKLTIERGVLQFAGPLENPQLNVRAVRTGLPVVAGVEVLGTVAHPRVRLVSTPDVPEPEKLSWLVLGRGPSDLTAGDASLLVQAASSMLGKTPGEDIGKKLGFDEVKIGRASTNSVLGVLPESTVAGRIGSASAAESVTVGRSLTRDVHLSYEQELGAAEGTLKLAWKLTRHFELLARAGYLPGLDAVYRWTFE